MTSLLVQAALCDAKATKFYEEVDKIFEKHQNHSRSRRNGNDSDTEVLDSIVVGGAIGASKRKLNNYRYKNRRSYGFDDDEFRDLAELDIEGTEGLEGLEDPATSDDDDDDDDDSIVGGLVGAASGRSNGFSTPLGDVIVCAGPDSTDTSGTNTPVTSDSSEALDCESLSSGTLSASSEVDDHAIEPADPFLKAFFDCTSCYHALLDSFLAPYTTPRQTYYDEWYTSVQRHFVADLIKLMTEAKDRKIHPEELDRRVGEEKRRWYIENLKHLKVPLLTEGDRDKKAFTKLRDDVAAGRADLSKLTDLVTEILRGLGNDEWPEEMPEKLLAAENRAQKVAVLKEAFLVSMNHKGYREVPRDHLKYVKMLEDGKSMEYVIDQIMQESQKANGAKEDMVKVKRRLEELRRARATHELEKKRKAQRRELALKNKVPDVMYDLPPCAACGKKVNPRGFKACPICTLLVGNGVFDQKQTVFCSAECEKKGFPAHAPAHKCASGAGCRHSRKARKAKSHHRPGAKPRIRPPPAPPLFRQAVTSSTPITGPNAMPIRGVNHPPNHLHNNHNFQYHNHNHSPLSPLNPHNQKGPRQSSTDPVKQETLEAPSLPPLGPRDMLFCKECLVTRKKQTIFCCESCALQNYERHSTEAHPYDHFRQTFSGANVAGGHQDSGVLRMHVVSYDDAVREFGGKFHVSLRRMSSA